LIYLYLPIAGFNKGASQSGQSFGLSRHM